MNHIIYPPSGQMNSNSGYYYAPNGFSHETPFPQFVSPNMSQTFNNLTEMNQQNQYSPINNPFKDFNLMVSDQTENTNRKRRQHSYYSSDVIDDGFHWRKYGQKFSKNNPFPTCYYKCAFPGCPCKRQISKRFEDAEITSVYKGEHNHSRPTVRKEYANSQEEFRDLVLKYTMGDVTVDVSALPKPSGSYAERRLIVEASNNVDFVVDGFSWKKYGQKTVKGSNTSKSYFKCAHKDCCAKKLVQKNNNSPDSSLIITYEHEHHHSPPEDSNIGRRSSKRPMSTPPPSLIQPENNLTVPVNGTPYMQNYLPYKSDMMNYPLQNMVMMSPFITTPEQTVFTNQTMNLLNSNGMLPNQTMTNTPLMNLGAYQLPYSNNVDFSFSSYNPDVSNMKEETNPMNNYAQFLTL
eukprot:TRINITY_DN2351_c0_g2_i1.p1 TRINITY_DN2351_c0_g2~~TRINITY_DN2351_c0_g2_i1.p1  ORF type:complete len:406 (+),score=80.80 TRINITY_DN2351_c0_g2_i1:120-1337(+)